MYIIQRNIHGRDVTVKQINSFEVEITIEGKPICVQINRGETFMNLIKDCFNLCEAQTEMKFGETKNV